MADDDLALQLGRVARARREHLGLRHEDIPRHGGPGRSSYRNLEKARGRVSDRTARLTERALGWDIGTVTNLLAERFGGATVEHLVTGPGGVNVRDRLRREELRLRGVSDAALLGEVERRFPGKVVLSQDA